MTGAEAESGTQALNGFLLATAERDGHADEEADGHLGGLDVYILKIDSNQDGSAISQEISRLVRGQEIQFFTGFIPRTVRKAVRGQLLGTGVVFIDLAVPSSQDQLTMDGMPFTASFSRQFGSPPLNAAHQGYRQARLIDRVVRALEGDFTDADKVSVTFEGLIRQKK